MSFPTTVDWNWYQTKHSSGIQALDASSETCQVDLVQDVGGAQDVQM